MKITSIASVLLGSACLVSVCHAADDPAAIPLATTQNAVTYFCGGVGSDEAAKMKQAARDYNLMLTFASRSGNYLSDVNVDIADAHGHSLLTTTCDGPIMLVDVPKGGRYRIRGEVAGRTVTGMAVVRPGAKGMPLHLVLPPAQGGQG